MTEPTPQHPQTPDEHAAQRAWVLAAEMRDPRAWAEKPAPRPTPAPDWPQAA